MSAERPSGIRTAYGRLIALGKISKAHGIRGLVHVQLFNSESALLESQKEVWLRKGEKGVVSKHRVLECSRAPKALIMQLSACESRDDADAIRGADVCVPRAAFPSLEPGRFYFSDLEGLKVWLQDECIGQVVRVLDYPSINCLEVRVPGGTYEVPLGDPWIASIAPTLGRIEIKTLDSLTLIPSADGT